MSKYKPIRTELEIIKFIERNICVQINEYNINKKDCPNYVMFTEITQHVYGNTIRELFDEAIRIEDEIIKEDE